MLWLALYCPTLALDCVLRRCPVGYEPAIAVTETDGPRRVVFATTTTAQAAGVVAGQSVPTALALLPDLVVVPRKVDDERQALIDAALVALRFTPTVSLRAAGLVMEISASLRLFGGQLALRRSLADAIKTQGLRTVAAEAPTPHGAWLLAKQRALQRSGAPATVPRSRTSAGGSSHPAAFASRSTFEAKLGAVSVGLLESLESTWHQVTGIGARKLLDLGRLPTSGVARRFGPGMVEEIARARGDTPDPQSIFEAPTSFESRLELMARLEHVEPLVIASQRLVEQLCGWLTARRAAVRGFALVLHHERWRRDAIAPTEIPIAVATPSSDPRRLLALIRERMSRLELKAPVLELSIAAPRIVEEREAVGTLFPERERATETLARLIEKLVARLSEQAMIRILRRKDHRPERAWREAPGMEAMTASIDRNPKQAPKLEKAIVQRPNIERSTERFKIQLVDAQQKPIASIGPTTTTADKLEIEVAFGVEILVRDKPIPLGSSNDPTNIPFCDSTPFSTHAHTLQNLTDSTLVDHEACIEDSTKVESYPGLAINNFGFSNNHVPNGPASASHSRTHEIAHAVDKTLRPVNADHNAYATTREFIPLKLHQTQSLTEVKAEATPSTRRPLLPTASSCFDESRIETFADVFSKDYVYQPLSPNTPHPTWLLMKAHQLQNLNDCPIYESLPLFIASCPERIEVGWWEDLNATRDYFIARNISGKIMWIYRKQYWRVSQPSWHLQGIFS